MNSSSSVSCSRFLFTPPYSTISGKKEKEGWGGDEKTGEQKREGSSDRPSVHRYNVPLLRLLVPPHSLGPLSAVLSTRKPRHECSRSNHTISDTRPGCACHCRLTIQPGDTCMTYRLPATVTSCHDALLPTDALLINFTSSARPRGRGRWRPLAAAGFSRRRQPCLDLCGRWTVSRETSSASSGPFASLRFR